MEKLCTICRLWKNESDMENNAFCKGCKMDRLFLSTEIEGIPVHLYGEEDSIRMIITFTHVPSGGCGYIQDQAIRLIKEKFTPKADYSMLCNCCNKPVEFQQAIIVSYEGETIALCDFECYIKLKEGEISC